jgi:uncharacterized protein (DUF58 family)
MAKITKRSIVIFFTDITDKLSCQRLVSALRILQKKNMVICCFFDDPGVKNIAQMFPKAVDQIFEKAAADIVLNERAEGARQLSLSGIVTVSAAPSNISGKLINSYYRLRNYR